MKSRFEQLPNGEKIYRCKILAVEDDNRLNALLVTRGITDEETLRNIKLEAFKVAYCMKKD